MSRELVAITAFTFVMVSGSAYAADLIPEPVEVAPPAAMPFDWSGFYAGVHAGYAWGSESDNQGTVVSENGPLGFGTSADSFNLSGFVGGVHGGYNWQAGQFVFGVEGDIDYADISGSHNYNYFGGGVTGDLSLESNWQASARLRAGYAIDNFLVYGTGGIAFADATLSSAGWSEYRGGPFSSDDGNTHVGWTVGTGAEYAFSQNWIGRAELRYSDFGNKTYQLLEGPVEASWTQTTISAGLNYKF